MSVTVSVIGEEMSKKRANGEGTVYKTKDGRVVGVYEDTNGRTRYMTSKTMSKAEMKAGTRKKLEDRDHSIAYDSEVCTLEKDTKRWLESRHDRVRPEMLKPYEAIVKPHIKSTLGKSKLEKPTSRIRTLR